MSDGSSDFGLVFTNLDSLFDTRLAMYKYIASEEQFDLLWKTWRDRLYDRYDPIMNYEKYRDLYSRRDKSLLKVASLTNLFSVIQAVIIEREQLGMTSPELLLNLCINIHPYKLDSTEKEAITGVIRSALAMGSGLEIIYVSMTHSELTPTYILSNRIIDLFLVDGEEWLIPRLKNSDMVQPMIKDTTLYLPGIMTAKAEPAEQAKIYNAVLPVYKEHLSHYIKTEFIEMKVFSRSNKKRP
jgi:hypothetical protein